jgi:N-acetylneuraminic acid mutarotase
MKTKSIRSFTRPAGTPKYMEIRPRSPEVLTQWCNYWPTWYSGNRLPSPLLATAALALLVAASVVYAQGTWTTLQPLPEPTEGLALGHVGNVIIAAYGLDNVSGDTNLTRLYDISSDSWSFGAEAPLPPRSESAYGDTTHGGSFYVIGGRADGGVLNNLERYDPATDTWTTLTPMTTARAAAAAAVQDDAIYVIGGRESGSGPCSGGALDVVERYDIATDTWTTVAPLPSPRSDAAAVEHGGKIYVFGGCSDAGFLNEVLVYNPVTDTWSSLTPMPTARASLVANVIGDNVYAIGGFAGDGPLDVNEVYNIPSDSWSTAEPIPVGRGEAGIVSHGGRVYVVGGGQPAFGSPTDANEVFKPNPSQ